MVDVMMPYEFIGGTKAIAKQVNANFEAVAEGFAGINVELEQLKSEVVKFNNKPLRDSFDIIPSLLGKAPAGAYPLWTGEWIYNARTLFKEFWAKALEYKKDGIIRTLSTEDYDKEVGDYSETGAFVIDELNGHIRLPKILHFVSGISDLSELGKPAHDMMQGHKHSVSGVFAQNKGSGNNLYGFGYYISGTPEIGAPVADGTNGEPRTGKYTQPRHIKCALYIQVANNTADISTLDTKVISEQLSEALTALGAKNEEEVARLSAEGKSQIEVIGQTINKHLLTINETGDEQTAAVNTAGTTQVSLVAAEGTKQVGRVMQSGSTLVATGTVQTGLVTAEGDKQVKRVQDIGANLQNIGDTQVKRVQTVVAEEVDKKLPEITGKVNEVIAEGNRQIQLVTENGTEQVNLAKEQALAAANSANEAAANAESVDNANIVHLRGNETITGLKTIENNNFIIKNPGVDTFVATDADRYTHTLDITDKNNMVMARVQGEYNTNGDNIAILAAAKKVGEKDIYGILRVGVRNDGTVWSTGITPPNLVKDSQIVTGAYANKYYKHKAYEQSYTAPSATHACSDTDQIVTVVCNDNLTFTTDLSHLTWTADYYTIQMRLLFPNGVKTITFSGNGKKIVWVGGKAADFRDGKSHWVVTRTAQAWDHILLSDAGTEG